MSKLESLKPLPKTVLPKIQNFEVPKSETSLSYAPIHFSKCPEAPNLNLLKSKHNVGRPKESFRVSKAEGSSESLLKSYNKFMNGLNPMEQVVPKDTKEPITDIPKLFEEPKPSEEPKDSEEPKVLKESKQIFDFNLSDSDPTNIYLDPKKEDLDEDIIEKINVSKKDCKVRVRTFKNFSSEKTDVTESSEGFYLRSYTSVRENTDNVIFGVKNFSEFSEDSEDLYKFYAVSKQKIFDEYMQCHKQLYFHLKVYTSKDCVTVFWIPMTQIVKLLEYSHPVYEIEKTKFSMNLYNLNPVKLLG